MKTAKKWIVGKRLAGILPYAGLVLLGGLVYFKALFFGLTYLDDYLWVKDYHWFLKDFTNGFRLFFQPDVISPVFYRPLLNLSFILDANLYGGIFSRAALTAGSHFTSLFLHFLATGLVFKFFLQWSGGRSRPRLNGQGRAGVSAFLLALLFCVHPALTQAVVWIPGRTDSLLAIFVLASMICFMKYLRASASRSPASRISRFPDSLLLLLAHFFFYGCALLTKETAVVLPVAGWLYMKLEDNLNPKSKRSTGLLASLKVMKHGSSPYLDVRSLYKFVLLVVRTSIEPLKLWFRDRLGFRFPIIIPWLLITALWFFIHQSITGQSPVSISYALQTLLQSSPAILLYWGKIFLPVNLSVLPVLRDSTLAYGVIAAGVVMIFIAYRYRVNRLSGTRLSGDPAIRRTLFGVSWFLLFLLPSLVLSTIQHEYRLYLPTLGGLIAGNEILSAGLLTSLKVMKHGSSPYLDVRSLYKFVLLVVRTSIEPLKLWFRNHLGFRNSRLGFSHLILVIIIFIFAVTSFGYANNFKDRLAFWTSAVHSSPDAPLARRNLGAMYYLDNRLAEAEAEFKEALALNAWEPMAHNNLGLIYMQRRQFKAAEEEFRAEVAINPRYYNVYFNWGLLSYAQGENEAARKLWRYALFLNPDFVPAREHLRKYLGE